MKKEKTFWERNKDKIIFTTGVLGGIGLTYGAYRYLNSKITNVSIDLKSDTPNQAILIALSANTKHGLFVKRIIGQWDVEAAKDIADGIKSVADHAIENFILS